MIWGSKYIIVTVLAPMVYSFLQKYCVSFQAISNRKSVTLLEEVCKEIPKQWRD